MGDSYVTATHPALNSVCCYILGGKPPCPPPKKKLTPFHAIFWNPPKEGPYQDRPPLCPFRLLPLPIYSGSAIEFLKFQGPKSKNIENRKYNPPPTLNSNQIPQMQQ